jgi:DNA-binding MarR family transcriptional regulator
VKYQTSSIHKYLKYSSIYIFMYTMASMKLTEEIVCQDMMSLLSRFKQEMLRMADEHKLTTAQLSALYMLEQHGELAMGKVAHVLHCDPSNVTGIVDRLVAHKLVSRQECPTDRRAKTIALTAEGEAFIRTFKEMLPSRMGCEKLSQAEREGIHSAVEKIAA